MSEDWTVERSRPGSRSLVRAKVDLAPCPDRLDEDENLRHCPEVIHLCHVECVNFKEADVDNIIANQAPDLLFVEVDRVV